LARGKKQGEPLRFVDGISERLRAGQAREPVLAAWGIGEDGRKILLHLMAGSNEDTETVRAFFQDMRGRGLGDPLLVVSDGPPGIIRAIEECFPRSARQRCLAHRMRNLAVKVPTDLWPEFKARASACYQARRAPSPMTSDPGRAAIEIIRRAAQELLRERFGVADRHSRPRMPLRAHSKWRLHPPARSPGAPILLRKDKGQ
jgi:hypothetical protein